jgi:hypothetical protein
MPAGAGTRMMRIRAKRTACGLFTCQQNAMRNLWRLIDTCLPNIVSSYTRRAAR